MSFLSVGPGLKALFAGPGRGPLIIKGSGDSRPVTATSFSVSIAAASSAVGTPVAVTVVPSNGVWPSSQAIFGTYSGPGGLFASASVIGGSSAPVSFNFAASSAGSGMINVTIAGMSGGGGQGYTATAPVTTPAVAPTSNANRFDVVMDQSVAAPGATATGKLYPNGLWNGGIASVGGVTLMLPNSGAAALSFSYATGSAGEASLVASNTAGLYNPYPAPLNVFAPSAGTARTLGASLTRTDMATFQRDTANGAPTGFPNSFTRGWGEVWINITSLSGATNGLWVRLYDALSSGASGLAGTGTQLTSGAVQIYGAVSAPGTMRVLLPASASIYYAEIATDAAFTNPIRLAQRFRVGVVIGHNSRSQESGLSRAYAYTGSVALPTSYAKTATWVGFDYRYGDFDSGWFLHDGVTVDPYQYHYSEASSSGAQEIGRLLESQLGVCVGIAGTSASGGGLDVFVNHDGSFAGGFASSVSSGVGSKFRYLWMSVGGWEGVDSFYPSETHAEVRTRMIAAADWVARNYPACAVVGWCAGATGWFGSDGSRPLGYTRNQMIALNEIEPVNPMFVSRENYAWNEYYGNHATMAARVQYARAGFRLLMAAEVASLGGLGMSSRGPRLATAGTIATGSRVIRIPYTTAVGTSLQAVGITSSNPNFTVGSATNAELASLFAVYGSGGYQGNGQAIKIDSAAINAGAGTIDLTLTGSSGITNADSTIEAMPSGFSVQFAADFGASNATVALGSGRVVIITDNRSDVANGIPHGWHMRPALDIAISTV